MRERHDRETAAPFRPRPGLRLALQAVLVGLFVGVGLLGFHRLRESATPPAQRDPEAVARAVRVLEASRSDAEVTVVGHGTARAKHCIPLSTEVSGKVIRVSPRLHAGHRVPRGALLVELEPDTYRNALAQAAADEKRLEAQIRLLESRHAFDRERLTVSERAAELAKREFERVSRLLRDDRVGTEAGVDAAEGTHLQRLRDVIALKDAVAAHPLQVGELEAALEAARARRAQAELDLARTRITAPFDARVESAAVQVGQVVTVGRLGAGTELAVLSDLSVLEVPVALDSDELRWLPITGADARGEYAFDPEAAVAVRWVADPERGAWRGRISRLERFEIETRTLTLVVEVIDNPSAAPSSGRQQLEEGMFCRVEIDGPRLPSVFRVPRVLVRPDGTVPVCAGGRLVLRPVRVARIQGDAALVDRGLEPGDQLVVTPLAHPVPGMALRADAGAPAPAAGRAGGGGSTRP